MMNAELDINYILKNLSPQLNEGAVVFCSVDIAKSINDIDIIASIVEKEGRTIVLKKEIADQLMMNYKIVMSWITLNVNSSLELIGLTSIISKLFADNQISFNLIAGYYHDHIFVPYKDSHRAINLLHNLIHKLNKKH